MENRNNFDLREKWPLYTGIILLVFAGLLALTVFGHGGLLSLILGLICFVLVVLGFLAGSIFGAGFGLLVWFVIKKSFERFTVPCLILFVICGIGLIVWYTKKSSPAAAADGSDPKQDAAGEQPADE